MSDLGFDPRPYCERLARAGNGRFLIYPRQGFDFRDRVTGRQLWFGKGESSAWAFFGPLADELKVEPWRIAEHAIYVLRTGTLLESIIAAVVESFEAGQ